MGRNEVEAKGEETNPPLGVIFRLEIESMRRSILNHVMVEESQLAELIDEAIKKGLEDLRGQLASAVYSVIDRQVGQMIRERVQNILWSDEVVEAVDKTVKEKIRKEIG